MLRVKTRLSIAISFALLSVPAVQAAQTDLDFRLRFESVEQDNTAKDASGLTLRTRLTHKTDEYNGFSGVVEFEDVRTLLGVSDYNNTQGDYTEYSVIADPKGTELDQGFIQYKKDAFSAKVGRQVIKLDGVRFVGDVGWRQDRQTFDAATLNYTFSKDIALQYSFINKRNRIFADTRDIDSTDHLINASFNTDFAKFVVYSYLLSDDDLTDNSLNTFGASFKGKKKLDSGTVLYSGEIATQSSETAGVEFDANYYMLEVGYGFKGITAKLGFESLGSDDANYGFSTPLATLHKFNGWADTFLTTPAQGLDDLYVSATGKAFKGKWLVAYHNYSANEATSTVDDLGSEINIQYVKPIAKKYAVGVKYADYSAGDSGANKVDTQKLWVWVSAKF
ncbi:alginate export family protein [Pseudoalteromonas sp. MMG010]|uniref:alginate export family protein n=1 Tax=Pseudoalteromonas sp. MMG010 TaxID=2822685 RepID=UPI001FFD9626|nr:alginate export family protein [Pseudoalteromonas sp. MMG010]